MKNSLLKFSLLVLLFSQFAFAQWNKGKGNGYYKVSASYLVADEHFTSTRKKDPNATRGNFVASVYAEHGIGNKLDLIAYLPLFTRVYQNEQVSKTSGAILVPGEAVNSIGDIELGARLGVIKNDYLALSTTVKLGLPTGKKEGGADGSLQTGDGEFNQLLLIDLGFPFKIKNQNSYGKIYSGFNNRTNGFSDELHYGAEIGTKFNNAFFVALKFSNVSSLNNGNLTGTGQGVFANNVEFTNLGGELAYYVTPKLGVMVNYTHVLTGKITFAAPTYTAGLFMDIQ
ncbi:hypothetical protein [Flavobacterium sp. UMI-01]|uniref:hypothetical protein n=1 Tax=Flavobacterium sp. UMI-01 TaxID=1441053 RepID=UPI001C7CFC79|nr:hypothetical protein [Flavobacterium sp. UMI-01]GIZ08696.1 hypothetical protein FUMI01_14230 [Flavobacterium sp. UMI-01]